MYSFQINLIFNYVVYHSKCPILSSTHTCKKGPVMPSLKKIRCVTREEKLFQTRVRCFQHLSVPRAPSTPTRAEHLTLARNSSFSPLVAHCTSIKLGRNTSRTSNDCRARLVRNDHCPCEKYTSRPGYINYYYLLLCMN